MKKFLLVLSLALVASKNLRFADDASAAGAGTTVKSFKGFDNFNNAVGQICGMWTNIVSAFKTTHETRIKKYINGEGFRKLSLSTTYQAAGGFRMSAWEAVWNRKLPLYGLEGDKLEKAVSTLEFAQFSDTATWASTTLGFNTEEAERDKVKSITIVTNVRDDNKFDYVLIDFALSFKFAPDIQWVSKAGSYAGGIYANQKDELIEVPRNITDEDVTALMEMFKVLSLKAIAALAGVVLEIHIG